MTRQPLRSLAILLIMAGFVLSCTQPPTPSPSPPPATVAPKPKSAATTAPAPARTTPAPKPATKAPPAAKGSQASPFEGKTIEIMVSSAAGGGTDTTARLVAGFLSKYIPGNPKIVVRNQPGGEGAIANNNFAARAKPDGLTLITNAASQITIVITRPDIAQYDPSKYEQVGNIARATSVLIIRKDAMDRLTDPKAKPVNVSVREGNETWAAMPLWGQEFLGWNLKWILGFGGTSEMELAIRRGEIDMFGTGTERTINQLVKDGIAVPLTQEGMVIGGKLGRRPDFPDTPIFDETLGSKKPTGLPWQAYHAWLTAAYVDKWLSAAPGTPPATMKILRDAFAAMAKDREFDQMVKRVVSPIYSVGVGDETAALVKQVLDSPPEAFKYGVDLQRKFGITAK